MARFTLDFTKSPLFNLVGLINANNQRNYNPADIRALTPESIPLHEGRNTKVKIDLLRGASEVDGDYVEFEYGRVGLPLIFSHVDVAEVDKLYPSEVYSNDELNIHKVSAALTKRFKFAFNATDYIYELDENRLIVTAHPNNLIYTGTIDFFINATVVLEGEAEEFINNYSLVPVSVEIIQTEEPSVTQRGELGEVVAGAISTAIEDVASIEGAIGFRNGTTLEFVSDKAEIKRVLEANAVYHGGEEPENPTVNDIWFME